MPKTLFFQLDLEKQNRIIEAGLEEFANQKYSEASTNKIVKLANISKGSLFKYFINKEDLYFYLLDKVIEDFVNEIQGNTSALSGDFFDVIVQYATIEFNWHISNPLKYKIFIKAFLEDKSEISYKVHERYKFSSESMYENLVNNFDCSMLKGEKSKSLHLIKWIIEGFNRNFINRKDLGTEPALLKEDYLREIKDYLEMIKVGIYK